MMEFDGSLVGVSLGGGCMGDTVTSASNIVSLVAAWLGGGVSFPSWRYKAY